MNSQLAGPVLPNEKPPLPSSSVVGVPRLIETFFISKTRGSRPISDVGSAAIDTMMWAEPSSWERRKRSSCTVIYRLLTAPEAYHGSAQLQGVINLCHKL